MATNDYPASRLHAFCTASQNFVENLQFQLIVRKADYVEGSLGLAPHSVNVTQAICRSDLAEQVRIVHEWWEKVQRLKDN